jgi:hypothetical protein
MHSCLGTRWRRVVSFPVQPLYPQGKIPHYPMYRRLGGTQSRSGRGGKEKKSNPGRPTRTLVTIMTELCKLYVPQKYESSLGV